MASPPLHFDGSPSDHFLLDFSTNEVKSDEHTTDGWTFAENKAFEQCLVEFETSSGTSNMDFFEFVEKKSLHWKTKESIKLHYEAFIDDLALIDSSSHDYQKDGSQNVTGSPVNPQEPTQKTNRPKKKAIPWTEDEHKSFLMGLQALGKGHWKNIAEQYVTTRTPAQVASHAQKFEKRIHTNTPADKQRATINDIQEINGYSFKTNTNVVQIPQTNAPRNYYGNKFY